MTTLTIKTIKGATVTLESRNGTVQASVNGKLHTNFGVTLAKDSEAGNHLALAGKVRASVNDADVPMIAAFLASAETERQAYGNKLEADYLASPEAFHDRMAARMYGRNSNH